MNPNTKFLLLRLMTLMSPITMIVYRSKYHRKSAIRLMLFLLSAPLFGYFRRPFIKQSLRDQLNSEIQIQQQQMKQSLENIQININDNNYEYLIVVRSTANNINDNQLYSKQKKLFELNNQILEKTQANENYFEGIRFLFLGEQRIYKGFASNLPEDKIEFEFHKKQPSTQMMMGKQEDKIFLMARQENGDQRIIMEWGLTANLKAVMRQISKHKHKKYVQSMNF